MNKSQGLHSLFIARSPIRRRCEYICQYRRVCRDIDPPTWFPMPVSLLSSATAAGRPQVGAYWTPRYTTDPQCERCSNPSTTPFTVDPNEREWRAGDIVILNESIHLPIDTVLGNPVRLQSTGSSSAGGSRCGKERSAIVWKVNSGPTGQVTGIWYVLMASYEGLHTYDSLPKILKAHFAVPVSRHCEIRPGDSHLHTTPEWQARHIWLVAVPFRSDGHVVSRWGWKDVRNGGSHQDDKGFRVEGNAWIQLRGVIESKMRGWTEECMSRKKYPPECKEEYDVSSRQACGQLRSLTWQPEIQEHEVVGAASCRNGAESECYTQQVVCRLL